MTETKRTRRPTRLQLDVLRIVRDYGPVSARGVAYHLNIASRTASNVLVGLERRGSVERFNTAWKSTDGIAYTLNRNRRRAA
jgi:predicted transcriptional regulator